ncbi:hypothetical protein K474DRAFT_1683058 [Panus rudis PR-1116 ss-1]|nr:hypothetical protein K474DRAFT_1683058 [Panus rudis PR-1116 ss-1]
MQQQKSSQERLSQAKKLSRKSSKPIINWFQRKLAGTVRARRASDGDALRSQRHGGSRSPLPKDKHRRSSVPVPPLPPTARRQSAHNSKQARPASTVASTKPNTISLNDEDGEISSIADGRTLDSVDAPRTSSARDSTWSPNSMYEADEDASVRPIPPSAPPSPSPSRSSSSYLSDPRTFASMAASTKPTTVLSVDITGGMAHIAQAPPTPTLSTHRLHPHVRTHSGGAAASITFSALPPATVPSRPGSSAHSHLPTVSSRGAISLQAPQHTTHHPRNNPRPSSPPPDDASVLTLASSAFAFPYARIGINALALSGRASLADDSISHFSHAIGINDSNSHFLGDGDGEGDDERLLLLEAERDNYGDVDASVRALRPRSSRRGSWESEVSGWSAGGGGGGTSIAPGTPSGLRDRSLWTSGSFRTGARSVVDTEGGSVEESALPLDASIGKDENVKSLPPGAAEHSVSSIPTHETSNTDSTEAKSTAPLTNESHRDAYTQPKEKALETPKDGPTVPPKDIAPTEESEDNVALQPPHQARDDAQTLATNDNQTDVFVSAPSTPMAY